MIIMFTKLSVLAIDLYNMDCMFSDILIIDFLLEIVTGQRHFKFGYIIAKINFINNPSENFPL
jgi:hypothetical protein